MHFAGFSVSTVVAGYFYWPFRVLDVSFLNSTKGLKVMVCSTEASLELPRIQLLAQRHLHRADANAKWQRCLNLFTPVHCHYTDQPLHLISPCLSGTNQWSPVVLLSFLFYTLYNLFVLFHQCHQDKSMCIYFTVVLTVCIRTLDTAYIRTLEEERQHITQLLLNVICNWSQTQRHK